MTAAAAAEGAEDVAPSSSGGRTKLILLAVPLLIGVIGAGLWFTGILPGLLGMGAAKPAEHAETGQESKPIAPTFFELPDIIANLNGNPKRPTYLKLKAKLELARPEDAPLVQSAMPRLMDLFQTYLREMRPEELRGSAGTYRLREELIARAMLVVTPPARVTNVLFTEILVQ